MSALNAVLRPSLLALALLGSPIAGFGDDTPEPEGERFLVELLLISFGDLPALTDLPAAGGRAEAERMLFRAITGGADVEAPQDLSGGTLAPPAPEPGMTERTRAEPSPPADRPAEPRDLPAGSPRPVPRAAVRPSPEDDGPPRPPAGGDRLWESLRSHPSATVLAAPRVLVTGGATATIQTMTRQTFQYLEPQGEDAFRLVTTSPKELGVEITVTVLRGEGGGDVFRLAPLEAKSTTMDGREPIPGVNLDAGRPIINSRSVRIETRVSAGQVRLIPLPSEGRLTAVALRVSELPAER